MRATMHNGRAGKDGVFKAGHNDRDFNTEKAEHIDSVKSKYNWTWHRYAKSAPDMTFDEAERKFYEQSFRHSLDAQNERHRKARNYDRVKTMDEYRASKQTCPEEVILQIGRVGDTVSVKVLHQIALEQIKWEMDTFPNVKLLDAAIHVDEQGAPHMHKRQVWVAEGKDGLTVGQNKALKEMGLERPDMSKKESRYNNAKMTYTEQCRGHFYELCRKHGIELETDPKEASEGGLSLLEYQRRQEEKKLEALRKEAALIESDMEARKSMLDERENRLNLNEIRTNKELSHKIEKTLKIAARTLVREDRAELKEAQLIELEKSLEQREKQLQERVDKLQETMDSFTVLERRRKAELDKREKSITNSERETAEHIKAMTNRALERFKDMAADMRLRTERELERRRKKLAEVEDMDSFDAAVASIAMGKGKQKGL